MSNVAHIRPNTGLALSGAMVELIRRTVAKGTTNEEFDLFMATAQRMRLDPIAKQIHCVIYNAKKADKRSMAIIVGIGGLRAIAQRQGNYRPSDAPPGFDIDENLKSPTNPDGIISVEVRGYKKFDNEWFPISATAYWDEYAAVEDEWADDGSGTRRPTGKKTLRDTWAKRPRGQIVKCGEALMLRAGWPEDLSGVYADEELERSIIIDATATEIADEHNQSERQKRIGSKDTLLFVFEAGGALEPIERGQIADRLAAWTEQASGEDVQAFRERNAAPMRQFWVWEPNDALAIKKLMESKIAAIPAAKPAEVEPAPQSASAGPETQSEAAPLAATEAAAGTPQSDKTSGGDPYAWLAVKICKLTSATDLLSFQQNKLHTSQWWSRATLEQQRHADAMVSARAAKLAGL